MSKSLDILKPIAVYPGIYAVLCAPAGLCYIGKTERTMARRWSEHWALLTLGRHPNDKMQAAWKSHGGKHFEVAILEIVIDLAQLDTRERYWIRRLGNANERRY